MVLGLRQLHQKVAHELAALGLPTHQLAVQCVALRGQRPGQGLTGRCQRQREAGRVDALAVQGNVEQLVARARAGNEGCDAQGQISR